MERNTIEKILNFLKEKEGKELPGSWFASIRKLNLIKELENHPDNIRYIHEGDLHLSNTNITKLPNDLYVKGDLYLFNSKQLTELPNTLYVRRGLFLFRLNIKELPNDLYVADDLSLYGCKQIKDLPNNLHVGGDVLITGTQLADKYTDEEIYDIVASTGGLIAGQILRY
jgi:hypothetical protein